MNASNPKPWWQSRTVVFAVVTALCNVLAALGHQFTADDINQITNWLMSAAGLVATGMTIYYRIKADTVIGKPNTPSQNQPVQGTK